MHYNWHWFWDTGNGDMGNQGVHEMDIARWGHGRGLPKSVVALGGRYVDAATYKDQGQTPNMMLSVFDFDGTLLVFETRGLVAKQGTAGGDPFPAKVATQWYLEAGRVDLHNLVVGGTFYAKGKTEGEPLPKLTRKRHPGGPFGNFLDCVRSRKARTSTPKSSKATNPPPSVIWAISPTAWATRLR